MLRISSTDTIVAMVNNYYLRHDSPRFDWVMIHVSFRRQTPRGLNDMFYATDRPKCIGMRAYVGSLYKE